MVKRKKIRYRSYIKNIKSSYYACSNKCAVEKGKKTTMERYGVESPLQNEEILDKMIKTQKDRYGDFSSVIKKREITNMEKFGDTCIFKIPKYQEIIKKTNLIKYGVDNPIKNKDIRKKVSDTLFENYGVYTPMKSKEIMDKFKQTNIERYGVEFPSQNEEVFHKTQISGKKIHLFESTDIFYQGTYERDFLIFCKDNGMIDNIRRCNTIRYEFDGKERVYYPDFYFEELNLVIEIKSDYYYNLYLEKNISKMESCLNQG